MLEPSSVTSLDLHHRFGCRGRLMTFERFGTGHIHDTFLATHGEPRHPHRTLFQAMNTRIFTSPQQVMENLAAVTDHLRRRSVVADRHVLRVLRPEDGALLHRDVAGIVWRALHFIEGTHTHRRAPNPAVASTAATAFARFVGELLDFPLEKLHETIPAFADGECRVAAFELALDEGLPARIADAVEEIAFARCHIERAGFFSRNGPTAHLPRRVVHHDTKLDNLLFDERSGEALCVIDLDTVMPGTPLYDYADCVRSAAASAEEDDAQPGRAGIDATLLVAVTEGYLNGAANWISTAELEALPDAPAALTFTTGLRFLTDHLLGDPYFRTQHEGQNLARARTHFAMFRDLDAARTRLKTLVAQKLRRGDLWNGGGGTQDAP